MKHHKVSKYGWDGEKQLCLADLDHTSSSYTWIDGYWDSREAYDWETLLRQKVLKEVGRAKGALTLLHNSANIKFPLGSLAIKNFSVSNGSKEGFASCGETLSPWYNLAIGIKPWACLENLENSVISAQLLPYIWVKREEDRTDLCELKLSSFGQPHFTASFSHISTCQTDS